MDHRSETACERRLDQNDHSERLAVVVDDGASSSDGGQRLRGQPPRLTHAAIVAAVNGEPVPAAAVQQQPPPQQQGAVCTVPQTAGIPSSPNTLDSLTPRLTYVKNQPTHLSTATSSSK